MDDNFASDSKVEMPGAGQLIKAIALIIVVSLLFGLVGLGYLSLIYLFSLWNSGRNAQGVHDIKAPGASRLGGLVGALIFVSAVFILVLTSPYKPGSILYSSSDFWQFMGMPPSVDISFSSYMEVLYQWSVIIICALLGLRKDYEPNYLSPKLGIAVSALLFGLLLYLVPDLIIHPEYLSAPLLDQLLKAKPIAWAITTVWCLFFVHAFKRIDEANGLVPGISTFALVIFFIIRGYPAEAALLFSCTLFLLFNVIYGRLFFGAMGSYALGAYLVIYSLQGFAQGIFSAAFLLALFAYPCIDFLTSIEWRLTNKLPLFIRDNGYLHNLIYNWLKASRGSGLLANSLTGVLISCSSSGLVLVGFLMQWWPATSGQWIWLFLLQCLFYWVVSIVLTRAGYVAD